MKNSDSTQELQIPQTLKAEVNVALKTAFQKVSLLIGQNEAVRELGFAAQLISKSPALQKCNASTIIDAVVNCARAKITLNPAMRLAYLIPRKTTATLDISYMGFITILKKSGGCKYIDATCVYIDEEFQFNPAEGTLKHTPYFALTEAEQKNRKIIGCYSRAVLPSNDVVFCYMPFWEIEKVKRFSEGSDAKWSAWQNWEEEMIKKTVIKRHFKMLVSGTDIEDIAEALRIEEENNPLVKQPTKSSLFDLDFDSE
jgi:recombination protein RecT